MPVTPNAFQHKAEALLHLYAEAEEIMLRKMARRLAKGADLSDWAQRKYAQINAIQKELRTVIRELDLQSGSTWNRLIAQAADMGARAFAADIDGTAIPEASTRIQAVVEVQEELAGRMSAYHDRILREATDGYRSVIGHAVSLAQTGTITTREAIRNSLDDFARVGISAFFDKSGRRWGMAEYAEMATRTGMMNAALASYTNDAVEHGKDLVIITDHSDECPLCRPWENRILSISGASLSDPACTGTLDQARAAGLFHPNCLHSFTIYTHGLTRVGGGDRQTAAQNAEGYKARQRLRACERNVRMYKRRQAAAILPQDERRYKAYADKWRAEAHKIADAYPGIRYDSNRMGARVVLSAQARKLSPYKLGG